MSGRRLTRAQSLVKRSKALECRLAGDSYREIAIKVGYRGSSGAFAAVESALLERIEEPTAQLRAMELARCDALTKALWPKVLKQDTDAIRTVLKIMERRAKLTGLDAPVKVDISDLIRDEARRYGLDDETVLILAREYDAGVRRG